MIGDWRSYALADFLPYGAEVYQRLVERVGESLWPLHGLTLLLGVVILLCAHRGRHAPACVLLAAAWAWVGVNFFIRWYAELNWAAGYLGGLFLLQAALLLGLAAAARSPSTPPRTSIYWAGLAVVLAGLAIFPLLGPLSGGSALQAETFGLHPDPTAVVTIGVALLTLRAPAMALAVLLPALWCLVSALHLQALGLPWWPVLLAVAAVAVAAPWGR